MYYKQVTSTYNFNKYQDYLRFRCLLTSTSQNAHHKQENITNLNILHSTPSTAITRTRTPITFAFRINPYIRKLNLDQTQANNWMHPLWFYLRKWQRKWAKPRSKRFLNFGLTNTCTWRKLFIHSKIILIFA